MQLFTWTDQFETGFETVDEQHRGLVALINSSAERVSANCVGVEDMPELLERLRTYADTHFRDEERLMTRIGVHERHVEEHKAAHAAFIEDIGDLDSALRSGSYSDPGNFVSYLSFWLAYHILGVDQSMARQANAIRSGVSPGDALAQEAGRDAGAMEPMLRAVNGLMKVVRKRNSELLELNRTLEQKVVARTNRLERLRAELEVLAMRDDLTQLANRRNAMLQLDALWDRELPVSVIMLDADRFKQVNDTYGHAVGDQVLKRAARVLQDSFRNDDVVCRLGGDEFLVICPDTDLETAGKLAAAVHRAINGLDVVIDGNLVWHGGMSIGVATRDAAMSDPRELLRAVDRAVYAAKRAGRNCIRTG